MKIDQDKCYWSDQVSENEQDYNLENLFATTSLLIGLSEVRCKDFWSHGKVKQVVLYLTVKRVWLIVEKLNLYRQNVYVNIIFD